MKYFSDQLMAARMPEDEDLIDEYRALIKSAETILLACATQYYVASGLHIDMDGNDGYGPLREARLWIEKYGSEVSKAELEKWKKR